MSPIFFVAFGLSGLTVAGLIRFTSRRVKRKPLRWLFTGFSLLLFFPLILVQLPILAWLVTTYRYDVAPQTVPAIHPPASATAVSYMYAPLLGTALVVEFKCGETEFLAWMKSRHWHPEPIIKPEAVTPLPHQHYRPPARLDKILIRDGYRFDDYAKDQFDDNGVTVVYDRATGTVFIHGTRF